MGGRWWFCDVRTRVTEWNAIHILILCSCKPKKRLMFVMAASVVRMVVVVFELVTMTLHVELAVLSLTSF